MCQKQSAPCNPPPLPQSRWTSRQACVRHRVGDWFYLLGNTQTPWSRFYPLKYRPRLSSRSHKKHPYWECAQHEWQSPCWWGCLRCLSHLSRQTANPSMAKLGKTLCCFRIRPNNLLHQSNTAMPVPKARAWRCVGKRKSQSQAKKHHPCSMHAANGVKAV